MTDPADAPPRVLLVEDDAAIEALLRQILEDEGFAVSSHSDLRGARAAVDADALPDLAVIDYQLPDGVGTDLCKRLRSRGVPCIVVSAYSRSLEPAIEVRADAWIAKPFEMGDVVNAVRELLTPSGALVSRLGKPGNPPRVLRLEP